MTAREERPRSLGVEDIPMGSARTPIIGGPRPLPRDRRAHPDYTLNCEEPVYVAVGQ